MKSDRLAILSLAAFFVLACGKDNTTEEIVDPNALKGEETYAVFDIVPSSGIWAKTVTPFAEEEAAVMKEADINDASVYVFKYASEDSGIAEIKQDLKGAAVTTGAYSGTSQIPSTAIKLSSGHKHIIVVANMTSDVKSKVDAAFGNEGDNSYANFYDNLVADLGEGANYSILNLVSADGCVTMSGETEVTLQKLIKEEDAKSEKSPNYLKIYIDRLPSKIDVAISNDNRASILSSLDVLDGTEKIGTFNASSYELRNIGRTEFIMPSHKGAFINSPWSDKTDWSFTADPSSDHKLFYPFVTEHSSVSAKVLSSVDQSKGANYRDFVVYMPENTNEKALKGNSTYVALKSAYTPVDSRYISGFDNSDLITIHPTDGSADYTVPGKVHLLNVGKPIPADQYTLYNVDYKLFFQCEKTEAEAMKDYYLKTLAAHHVVTVSSMTEIMDITEDEISVASAAAISGFDVAKGIKDAGNIALMKTEAVKAGLGLHVFYADDNTLASTAIKVVAYYVWDPKFDGAFVINEGIDFKVLTCYIYQTRENGVINWYRIDISDDAFQGETNMMYHSVVRNYSYHLNIESVNSIGYSSIEDLSVGSDGFFDTDMTIGTAIKKNQWVGKVL